MRWPSSTTHWGIRPVAPPRARFSAPSGGTRARAAGKALPGDLYAEGAVQVWGASVADLCEDAGVFDQGFFALKADTVFLDNYASVTMRPDMLPGGIPADAFDELESDRAISLAGQVLDFVTERTALS